jgi:rhamnogalacturonan endolyase
MSKMKLKKFIAFVTVFSLIANIMGFADFSQLTRLTQPAPTSASTVPVVEYLNRGIVSAGTGNGNLVSWRFLASDPTGTIFRLYRGSTLIHTTTATGATNFLDTAGTATSAYRVDAVHNGTVFCSQNRVIRAAHNPDDGRRSGASFDIPLVPPSPNHHPNDITVGDVDGDGEYELFVKWEANNARDNAHDGITDNVFIECIKFDGTRLWRINLGPNIRAGAHYTQMLVADFDLSGSAKLIVKTAEGTVDGLGNAVAPNPTPAGYNHNAIHRSSRGHIVTGHEFLTLFCGRTGANLHTIMYPVPRGNESDSCLRWGDPGNGNGNRSERHLGAVAYLDGIRPSAVVMRGYYTRMALVAYDVVNNRLVQKWIYDTGFHPTDRRARPAGNGGGNHNVMPAAVHGGNDHRQSILIGSTTIGPDGRLLWSSNRGHGDALHVGKFLPNREGLQIFMCHEESPWGVTLKDARTGAEIWRSTSTGDTGRCMAGNFLQQSPLGGQFWGNGGTINAAGTRLGNQPNSVSFAVWWTGSLERQLLNTTGSGESWMRIDRMTNTNGGLERVYTLRATSINGTKANPNISANLFGDWREQIIMRNGNTSLTVFTTTHPTEHRITTLMHDPQYRMQVAGQNICYNQPAHPSFFLGTGHALPARPNVTVRNAGTVTPPVTTEATTAAVPAISLSPTGTHTFAGATVGYTTAPAAQTFTVARTGNVATGAMTVALSGTNAASFELSTTSLASITATGTANRTFTVRPRTGLAAGTYTATVTVSGTGGLVARTATVRFVVSAAATTATTVTTATNATTTTAATTTTVATTTATPANTTTAVSNNFLQGVLIRDLNVLDTPNRAAWSIQNNPRTGQEIFGCHRTFSFTELPAQLADSEWIRMSGNSKDPQTNIATFIAGEDMILYIGLDSRVTSLHELPPWLSSYTLTNMNAGTHDGTRDIVFNLYRRNVSAGELVTLGTNGNPFNTMMYTVFAVPAPAVSTYPTEPTQPTQPSEHTTTPESTSRIELACEQCGNHVFDCTCNTAPPISTTTPPVTNGTTASVTASTTPSVNTTTGVNTTNGTTASVNTTTTASGTTESSSPTSANTATDNDNTSTDYDYQSEIATSPDESTAASESVSESDEQTSPTATDTDNQTTTADIEDKVELGDVNLDGVIDIADALEILKFLAGIDNVIEHGVNPELSRANAMITGESDRPSIGDALEILKLIAGMENKIKPI